MHVKWCICNLNFFQLLPEPSGLESAAGEVCLTSLYLRHLREQADGHRQGEAEGNQAHKAVDGQQQSAVVLQESQPTHVKTVIKGNVSLCGSIPDDYCEARGYF